MAGATFGRKGMAGGEIAAPRRAAFGAARPAPAQPTAADADDPYAEQRAAFLAAERARRGDAEAQSEEESRQRASAPRPAKPRDPPFPGQKTTTTAYLLWFFLGGISAHRFYLRRPLTAIGQTVLWYVSLMFYMAGFGGAGFLTIAGLLWIFADAFLIPNMIRETNDRLRAGLKAAILG